MNSYQKLIGHIKSQDWHKATNTFREVMEQKIALRLGEEQKQVAKTALTGQRLHEAVEGNWICDDCGKRFTAKFDTVWDAECPKCGAVGEGTVHKAWTQKDVEKDLKRYGLKEASVPPTKCKKCGKTSDFRYDGWCKDCWDKDDTVKESEHSGVFASENCGKK